MVQIRRRARNRRHVKILNQRNLLLRAAHARRHNRSPDLLGAVVQTQTAGEKTVTVGNLHHITAADTAGRQRTCKRLRPRIQILLRISDNGRLSRRSRRNMITHKLVRRSRKHLVRIIVAEILLVHEGEFFNIGKRTDVVGVNTRILHPVVVERRKTVKSVDQRLHQLILKLPQFIDRHLLNSRIPSQNLSPLLSTTRFALPSNLGSDSGSTSAISVLTCNIAFSCSCILR